MPTLHTTEGELHREDCGAVLPHEHVVVELSDPGESHAGAVTSEDVLPVMVPELEAARESGASLLVEATPEGMGRRVDIVRDAAEAADLPVVVATGLYQDPHIPDWARSASADEIAAWMVGELEDGIGDTGVRAGWIKVAASEDGLTGTEERILRAAARASLETGALVGSHTTDGGVAHQQLDVLEDEGRSAERFVWIHAQAETDETLHREAAARGAYVEYDWIGNDPADDYYLDRIEALCAEGHAENVLLSMDRGWYDPSEAGGGDQQPYTYLLDSFAPKLRARVGEETAEKLLRENPVDAYAR